MSLTLRSTGAVESEGSGQLDQYLEKPMTGHDHSYLVVGVPVSTEWLEDRIQHYLTQPEARREIGH